MKSSDVGEYEANRDDGWGWANFDDRDFKTLQEKYGLVDSKFLTLQIILKIPYSAFVKAKCIVYDLDRDSDGDTIIGENKLLAAMFRHSSTTENIKEVVFPFPSLATDSLKALLQYLYTGRVQLSDLSTTNVIEIADAAEQYALEKLKKLCKAVLWDRTVENPEECFEIIQFTDLHADMKYVKDRAMDVLAENYEKLGLHSTNLTAPKYFGRTEKGNRLKSEFQLFFSRRLTSRVVEKDNS